MTSRIEKYSLLKLKPALLSVLKTKTLNLSKILPSLASLRSSLYGVLDGNDGGEEIKGKIVVRIDGEHRKEFVVDKYERYKVKETISILKLYLYLK